MAQDFYYVHGIWVPAYVMEKGKMGRVLEVSGTRQNIAMASYAHDFIQRFIQSQWTLYNTNKKVRQDLGFQGSALPLAATATRLIDKETLVLQRLIGG